MPKIGQSGKRPAARSILGAGPLPALVRDRLAVALLDDGSEVLKPILVGQAPSRLTQERDGADVEPEAFSGISGARLAAFIGLRQNELLNRVVAINLLHRWPGRSVEKGDDFDVEAARISAAAILSHLVVNGPRVAILAGSQVLAAFSSAEPRLQGLEPLQRRLVDRHTFVSLPHPSPVNRWWNRLANVRAARLLLRELLGLER